MTSETQFIAIGFVFEHPIFMMNQLSKDRFHVCKEMINIYYLDFTQWIDQPQRKPVMHSYFSLYKVRHTKYLKKELTFIYHIGKEIFYLPACQTCKGLYDRFVKMKTDDNL